MIGIAKPIKSSTRLACSLLLLSSFSVCQNYDGPALLPSDYVPHTDSDSPGQTVINVPAGADLQASINNAACGTTLELASNATWTGNFVLPQKSCDSGHWVVIRNNKTVSPEGTLLTPCYAGVQSLVGRPSYSCSNKTNLLSTIVTPNQNPAFTLAPGANHYRLGPGLEITRTAGTGITYGLISKVSANDPATYIIVARDWIHGTPQDETQRGVWLSGSQFFSVVDSYLDDFHCAAGIGACVDSQAISGGSGTLAQGDWYIADNYLEAAGENIIFGGTAQNSTTPSQIYIENNEFFKPTIWKPGSPNFVGYPDSTPSGCPAWDPNGGGQCPFIVKNLLEFKNAQVALAQGNRMRYNWAGFSQYGEAVIIEGANTSTNDVNSQISVVNITIRYNYISHVAQGFTFENPADQYGNPNLPIYNFTAHDNLIDDESDSEWGDTSIGSWLYEEGYCNACTPSHDIFLDHNTEIVNATKTMLIAISSAWATPVTNFTYTNNIMGTIYSGLQVGGGDGSTNAARLTNLYGGSLTFLGNVLVGASSDWPSPSLNYYPSLMSQVQFTDMTHCVYSLQSTSPYIGVGTNGTNPGANYDALLSYLQSTPDGTSCQ